MLSLNQPLDLTDPQAKPFLEGVQGNILKSHGRDYASHIFMRFGEDTQQVRAWIAELARTRVTSAQRQRDEASRWKASRLTALRPVNVPFLSFLISHDGYVALGFPPDQIPTDPSGTYFERGMKNQADAERPFNDPPFSAWEPQFLGAVHAQIILAHDEPAALAAETDALLAELQTCMAEAWVEPGYRLTFSFPNHPAPVTIEHFGYQDGISDPEAILQDAEAERAQRGSDQWDPVAPLSLLFQAEPGSQDQFGSFCVFRKLEQNVLGFHLALDDLAASLGLTGADAERAGAMAVGRFRDGRPIIPPGANDGNNFNFTNADPTGEICPYQAHIRKSNPRGDTNLPAAVERGFRIARRGISYGERPDLEPGSTLPAPEQGVGLLFVSYQARLDNFAIQQEGSDANDFVSQQLNPLVLTLVGPDPVNGRNDAPTPQQWPPRSGKQFTIVNHVRLMGGEYFFAPSMALLRGLDDPAHVKHSY